MKHNLPAPSQAWGSDIDRRLAALESQVRLYDNKLSNSTDSLTALTQRVSANGVAQPFSFTEGRSAMTLDGDFSNLLYTRHLDWGEAGSFMLVAISGFVTVRLRDGITPSSTMYSIYARVTGEEGYGYSVMVPVNGSTLRATISYTTLLSYDEGYNPSININLSGLRTDNYLVSGSVTNTLQVSIAGVRY
mgnify:CR=1 FL=1